MRNIAQNGPTSIASLQVSVCVCGAYDGSCNAAAPIDELVQAVAEPTVFSIRDADVRFFNTSCMRFASCTCLKICLFIEDIRLTCARASCICMIKSSWSSGVCLFEHQHRASEVEHTPNHKRFLEYTPFQTVDAVFPPASPWGLCLHIEA